MKQVNVHIPFWYALFHVILIRRSKKIGASVADKVQGYPGGR